MIPGTAMWDTTMLSQLVGTEDIPKIHLVKPSISGVADQLVWHYTKDGLYSVKSGYHFLHSSNRVLILQADRKILKTLWSLPIPPIIKHFWGRVFHKALPVAESLKRRGIRVEGTCQLCGDQEESVNHFFNVEFPERFGNMLQLDTYRVSNYNPMIWLIMWGS